MRAVALCVLAAVAVVSATSLSSRVPLFNRMAAPAGWTNNGRAPAWQRVRFMLALKQRNLAQLEQVFWDVSSPDSPHYQQYMSIDAINRIVAPPAHAADTVVAWLHQNGAQNVKNYQDAVECTTSVALASKLFNCALHTFTHAASGKTTIRVFGVMSIPPHVAEHVNFVEGLTMFPVPHLNVRHATNDNYAIIAQTLQSMYQIPVQKDMAAPQTSVGVIEFQQQSFSPDNLQQYATSVNVEITAPTAADIVGPNQPSAPQTEAELDIQMAQSVDNAATGWFWLEDGQNWLYAFATHYFNTQGVPQVASISYAWSEMDECQINPSECQSLGVDSQGYVLAVNVQFQKIGARGLTILVASGDSGTNGRTDPQCIDPYLKPDFPACSPYVTSVGGTQVNDPQTNLPNPPPVCSQFSCVSSGVEVAVSYDVSSFASGGGFSLFAAQPMYQKSFVDAYWKSGVKMPDPGYFNKTNRGFPDVSALGHDCMIFEGGLEQVGGTSCAAPIWAAVTAILNQYAIKKTGKPLGFLNPWLYKVAKECPTCYHDITVGDNICTEQGCAASCEGFMCAKGWDPVTGLGSPNVANLIKYIQTH